LVAVSGAEFCEATTRGGAGFNSTIALHGDLGVPSRGTPAQPGPLRIRLGLDFVELAIFPISIAQRPLPRLQAAKHGHLITAVLVHFLNAPIAGRDPILVD
jgi:hypothetical protein